MNSAAKLILYFILAYPVMFGVGEIVNFVTSCDEKSQKDSRDDSLV